MSSTRVAHAQYRNGVARLARRLARVEGLRYPHLMTRGNQIKWVVVVALALALVGITFYPKSEPAERTEQALRPPVVSTLDPP